MSRHSRVKPAILRSHLRQQLSRALDQLTGSRHRDRLLIVVRDDRTEQIPCVLAASALRDVNS